MFHQNYFPDYFSCKFGLFSILICIFKTFSHLVVGLTVIWSLLNYSTPFLPLLWKMLAFEGQFRHFPNPLIPQIFLSLPQMNSSNSMLFLTFLLRQMQWINFWKWICSNRSQVLGIDGQVPRFEYLWNLLPASDTLISREMAKFWLIN
jgi:hypothetical protein